MKAVKWLLRIGATIFLTVVIAKLFGSYYEVFPRAMLDGYEDISIFLARLFGIPSAEGRGDLYLVILLTTCAIVSAILVMVVERLWRRVVSGRGRGAATNAL